MRAEASQVQGEGGMREVLQPTLHHLQRDLLTLPFQSCFHSTASRFHYPGYTANGHHTLYRWCIKDTSQTGASVYVGWLKNRIGLFFSAHHTCGTAARCTYSCNILFLTRVQTVLTNQIEFWGQLKNMIGQMVRVC